MKWLTGPATLCLGFLSLYWLLQHAFAEALCAHLAAALYGVLSARCIPPREEGSHLFEWLTALTLPAFGGFAAWLTVRASRYTPRTNLAEEYSNYIDPAERNAMQDIPELHYYLPPAPTDVEPIVQVLQSSAEEWEKRNAIEALLRLETPESIQLLKTILKEGSPEVKIYAASALSKLEERLALRMNVLQKRLSETPPEQCAPLCLALAQVFMDYIFYDMIDVTRRKTYIDGAISNAKRAWTDIHEPGAQLIVAQAYLYKKEYSQAMQEIQLFLESNPTNINALLVLAESSFYLGNYREVQNTCRKLNKNDDLPSFLADTIKIWV